MEVGDVNIVSESKVGYSQKWRKGVYIGVYKVYTRGRSSGVNR